ncbi:hypothetical protein RJ639_004615 [Escallonia herrerae]|uniref:Retrotransposon gag domain-containing protein n=1 Tax=Escallonia herrerae TaxID=1293975 RepID=A0AA88W9P1_9ASTE|nr:hypothetical protein RJ639_004615 [Escallonia herrerae]
MISFKSLPMFSSIFLLISILFTSTNAAILDIRNSCPFTVWAGAVPGGGRQLGRGQTWSLNVPAGTKGGRIWPRTNCKFDGSGRGTCQTAEENVVVEGGRDPLPPTGGKKGSRGQSKSSDALASLDGRTGHLEIAMGDVKDHVGMVEQNLQTLEDHVLKELKSLKRAVGAQDELRERFTELFNSLQEQLDVVKVGMEEIRQDAAMCKRAIAGGAVVTPSPRVDTPKPKEFGGKRDAKELDNYIWHMEQYFEGASITDEKTKVRTATLYLTDTATLWWHRKHCDIEKGLYTIDTWEVFKREIKKQFYPENVAYKARKKMKELRHKGSWMASTWAWNLFLLLKDAPVVPDALQQTGVITREPCLRLINIVATQGNVDRRDSRSFSRIDVRLLTVILKMIQLAHLHAPEGQIIGLYSALKATFGSSF